MGGGQICLCVAFSWEKGEYINKIHRNSHEKAGTVPGQSWDNPAKILFMCFLPPIFAGRSRIFAGISPEAPEEFDKEKLVFDFWPLSW